ncbi:DUF6270 domain-containing protein [Arthrobacter sp. CG_A4]|uniref:DUF6270 domain-containing protein n=1 Tax=Arthrobacter sp. CG_A4 TaxID=3071706 RepID=UPI002DFF5AD1|nr:hypothetical protein [Arthrobacter sp. CG_A4]
MEATNYPAWKQPVHNWESVGTFSEQSGWEDGIHVVELSNGNHLDVLMQSDPLSRGERDCVAVFFSGALTNRAGKLGPYFSGARVAQALGIPFIAFSDPALNLNGDLPLGWYAGSQKDQLQNSITEILKRFTEKSGRQLLLIGGSGGGFASLMFAHKVGAQASAFVWNPQTSILEYEPTAVMKYLDTAIPDHAIRDSRALWKEEANAALEESSIEQKLQLSNAGRVFYLQNSTDWHVTKHLLPYMSENEYSHKGNGFYSNEKNHAVVISEYGNGHAAPPVDVIHAVIQRMLAPHRSTRSIYNELINQGKLPKNYHLLPRDMRQEWANSAKPMFGIKVVESTGKLNLSVDWNHYKPGTGGVTAILRTYGTSMRLQQSGPLRDPHLSLSQGEAIRAEVEFADGFGNQLGIVTVPIMRKRESESDAPELAARPTGATADDTVASGDNNRSVQIFIYGSCVSRDAFEMPGAPSLVEYRARSGLGSAFSATTGLMTKIDLEMNSSAFQRRMVASDLAKDLSELLIASHFDYLLVDFIDERLQLIRSPQGYDTFSPELSRAGFDSHIHELVPIGSEEYFSAFESGWNKLITIVPADKIVLNKAFWATSDESDQDIGDLALAVKNNAILSRLYAHVLTDPTVHYIDYDEDDIRAKSGHKWGLSPFHYVDSFYHKTLGALNSLPKNT